MKLYATTTSERASKGQGGKYIELDIKNEDGNSIVRGRIDPQKNGQYYFSMFYTPQVIFESEKVFDIIQRKGNNQKDKQCAECQALNAALPGLNGQGRCCEEHAQ